MNVIKFFKAVKNEFHHVEWLNREAIIGYTVGVVLLTVFIAYYLGLFDTLFQSGLEIILSR